MPLRILCPKTQNTGDIFPDVSPFTGIAYPYVRSPLAQRIAASCFVLHLIALLFIVFPLRYLFPVDSETAADVRVFDYIEDGPSFLPGQPGKPPPVITRYRRFFSILLALEYGSMLLFSVNPILMHSLTLLLQLLPLPAILLLRIGC